MDTPRVGSLVLPTGNEGCATSFRSLLLRRSFTFSCALHVANDRGTARPVIITLKDPGLLKRIPVNLPRRYLHVCRQTKIRLTHSGCYCVSDHSVSRESGTLNQDIRQEVICKRRAVQQERRKCAHPCSAYRCVQARDVRPLAVRGNNLLATRTPCNTPVYFCLSRCGYARERTEFSWRDSLGWRTGLREIFVV